MVKPKVFISFDYDHDARMKDLLVGQGKLPESPFELADWSIKETIDENWKAHARKRIKAVDVVIVLCGQHADTATGVSAEIKIAQEVGTPYYLMKAYSMLTCKRPTAAKATDTLYDWSWPNLKKFVGK